ncbi:MAG: iron-sulfur cluster assembly scaffold protein [Methanomassiliicoccales archaeon]
MTKDDLESFVEQLQEEIDREERELYSEIVIEESKSPYHMYRMENPDGSAEFTGTCGDTMWIYLRVEGNRIVEGSFLTDGCGATTAVGSRLMRMIEGKTIDQAQMMTDDQLIESLGGLPEENLHCAELAMTALYRAIDDLYAKGVAT